MLEVAYKIVAQILLARLKVIKESKKHLEHENQCGFRNGRGCSDGSFTIKALLNKRREQNLETWVLFLDLVKAFDMVPRELLWNTLERFGVPLKLISVLQAMHKSIEVLFEVDGTKRRLSSTIGLNKAACCGTRTLCNIYGRSDGEMEIWPRL